MTLYRPPKYSNWCWLACSLLISQRYDVIPMPPLSHTEHKHSSGSLHSLMCTAVNGGKKLSRTQTFFPPLTAMYLQAACGVSMCVCAQTGLTQLLAWLLYLWAPCFGAADLKVLTTVRPLWPPSRGGQYVHVPWLFNLSVTCWLDFFFPFFSCAPKVSSLPSRALHYCWVNCADVDSCIYRKHYISARGSFQRGLHWGRPTFSDTPTPACFQGLSPGL